MKLGVVADEISRDFRVAVRIGTQAGLWRYEVRFLKTGRAPSGDRRELLEVERIRDGEEIEITALSPGPIQAHERRVPPQVIPGGHLTAPGRSSGIAPRNATVQPVYRCGRLRGSHG